MYFYWATDCLLVGTALAVLCSLLCRAFTRPTQRLVRILAISSVVLSFEVAFSKALSFGDSLMTVVINVDGILFWVCRVLTAVLVILVFAFGKHDAELRLMTLGMAAQLTPPAVVSALWFSGTFRAATPPYIGWLADAVLVLIWLWILAGGTTEGRSQGKVR
jgi:hypothetical protein